MFMPQRWHLRYNSHSMRPATSILCRYGPCTVLSCAGLHYNIFYYSNRKNLATLGIQIEKNNPKKATATSREKRKSTTNKLCNRQTKIFEETRFTRSLWNLLRHKRL